mgnify:CR=1 FL=1
MKPSKFFNFALPFETYQELRMIAIKKEISIAAIVRSGIDLLLKVEALDGQAKNIK